MFPLIFVADGAYGIHNTRWTYTQIAQDYQLYSEATLALPHLFIQIMQKTR